MALLTRPQGPLRVNRGNPATGRLFGLWITDDRALDITGRYTAANTVFSTPTSSVGSVGRFRVFGGANGEALTGTDVNLTTGDISFVAVCKRDVTPGGGGSARVQQVYDANLSGELRPGLNLGNSFGPGADVLKPRAFGGTVAAWLNGRKQSGVNPFTEAIANGEWVAIGCTHRGSTFNAADMRLGRTVGGSFGLDGGIALFAAFSGILPDAQMEALTRDPWALVEGAADRIRRIATVWTGAAAGGGPVELAAEATVSATVDAALHVGKPLAAEATTSAAADAALRVQKWLAAELGVGATGDASLSVAKRLAAEAAVSATVDAALSVPRALAAEATMTGSGDAALRVAKHMGAEAYVSATVDASLSGGAPAATGEIIRQRRRRR